MVVETGFPETFTKRTRLKGLRVGNDKTPSAASLASFASKLTVLSVLLIG